VLRRKMSFEVDSCICSFTCIYEEIWSPKSGDVLSCERELGNREDLCAVAAKKNNTIVQLDTCHGLFRVSACCFSGTMDA
jgi:hypothetical protein